MHRDVKPGNVLFDGAGRACLTDFGVARPQDATAITQTGQIPGTARYMAPELWRGEAANERTDLFALGVLLARCLDDAAPDRLIGLTERLSAENPGSASVGGELRSTSWSPESVPVPVPPVEDPIVVEDDAVAPPPSPPPAGVKPGPGGVSRWVPVAALASWPSSWASRWRAGSGGDEEKSAGPAGGGAGARVTWVETAGLPLDPMRRRCRASPARTPSQARSPAGSGKPAADPVALNQSPQPGFDLLSWLTDSRHRQHRRRQLYLCPVQPRPRAAAGGSPGGRDPNPRAARPRSRTRSRSCSRRSSSRRRRT